MENLIWKIAYNKWCNQAKKYGKEKLLIPYDEIYSIYEDMALDKIIYKEIINNLNTIGLTPKEKEAFRMYYIEDLSIKEICENLNTKEANIKYYLYSARNKIKERYCE